MCIMNQKNLGIIGIIIAVGIIILFTYQTSPEVEKQSKLDLLLDLAQTEFEEIQNSDQWIYFLDKWAYYPNSDSKYFYLYVDKNNIFVTPDGLFIVHSTKYIPIKEAKETFEEVGLFSEPQNTVVIVPIFTANAYGDPGFYHYFYEKCDEKCLTVSIQNRTFGDSTNGYTSSAGGVQVLKFLQYEMITDVDVDKNPIILKKYDKVIILHNEYVTKNEFDAITNHPNVIYLYPNALYAEIETDYEKNTMTLKRGHNYPEKNIKNGFDWEFDNSSMESDLQCIEWKFYEIDNGWMLNCYPELSVLINSPEFLKKLKDL